MKEKFPSNNLITRVFSAARIVDLQSPLPDPATVEGVWEDMSHTLCHVSNASNLAILCHRQIWQAQTTFPDAIRGELMSRWYLATSFI